ncbi:MAG: gamma-glutamylcyclotransferase [Planctomycetes bacterium]|nr:gamma-glutamylcyclotransferase [Planctomycetota bacterium]
MENPKYNLFIYGSLRDRRIFQSVSGHAFTLKPSRIDDGTLFAEFAFLPHYRRVSPDNVYFYAVPAPPARIEGLVIHDIPAAAMEEIDRYEGKRYQRETVRVHTGHGLVEAQAYLVTAESMRKHFGDRFHVNLIHELWLRKRIRQFLKKRTRPGDDTEDAEVEREADRELLATTERDLVMSHYHRDAVSDYYLEHELNRPRPSIKAVVSDPQVQPYLRNYLALVLRQVLLNQFDEQLQAHYRFELEHMRSSQRYFARSVSLLAALRMMNANQSVVEPIVENGLKTLPSGKSELIDYVKYAVHAIQHIFDARVAEDHLARIRASLQPGLVPLGCELELSNVGAAAVEPLRSATKASDPAYDGFKYFYDFHLHVLCWKLGGYIDDHSGYTDRPRRQGFFEIAPGRLSIAGELSRPATADPWLLSQLIHEIVSFYRIRPHSLHLSFQLRKNQVSRQRILPVGFVQCLLAMGGGLEPGPDGGLWLSRMGRREIVQKGPAVAAGAGSAVGREEFVFARTSRRNWYLGGDEIADRPPAQATTHVQQYKFIRLDAHAPYEPLILCLKGLQLAYNPGDYLFAEQMAQNPRLARHYRQLKEWANHPTPIGARTIGRFLDTVRRGLMIERHYRPAHPLHYIEWALNAIDTQLRSFNQQVADAGDRP